MLPAWVLPVVAALESWEEAKPSQAKRMVWPSSGSVLFCQVMVSFLAPFLVQVQGVLCCSTEKEPEFLVVNDCTKL